MEDVPQEDPEELIRSLQQLREIKRRMHETTAFNTSYKESYEKYLTYAESLLEHSGGLLKHFSRVKEALGFFGQIKHCIPKKVLCSPKKQKLERRRSLSVEENREIVDMLLEAQTLQKESGLSDEEYISFQSFLGGKTYCQYEDFSPDFLKIKDIYQKLTERLCNYWGSFRHSEQLLLYYLSCQIDSYLEVAQDLELTAKERVAGMFLHVHSHWDFCARCTASLVAEQARPNGFMAYARDKLKKYMTDKLSGDEQQKIKEKLGMLTGSSDPFFRILASFSQDYSARLLPKDYVVSTDCGQTFFQQRPKSPFLFIEKSEDEPIAEIVAEVVAEILAKVVAASALPTISPSAFAGASEAASALPTMPPSAFAGASASAPPMSPSAYEVL